MRELGTVRRFFPERGEGYIEIAIDRDVAFKAKDVIGRAAVQKGDRVEVTILELSSGGRRAVDVRIILSPDSRI
jgi:cold shock CspA family protein